MIHRRTSEAGPSRTGQDSPAEQGLGLKREFVDIPCPAKGREAPSHGAKESLRNKKKTLPPEELEKLRRRERRELFADQRHASQLMWQHCGHDRPGGVTLCGWTIIAGKEVEVMRETAPDKAPRGFIKGLQKCDLGWICPVCSRAKAQAGLQKVNALLRRGRRDRWQMVMMTLTARHHDDTPLDWLWAQMSQASDAVRDSHTWKRILKPQLVGSIRAVEATHGAHGWHPHFHVILVFKADAAADQAEAVAETELLRRVWMEELAKVGLDGNAHAFDVQGAQAAASYLTKWGMGEELALGAVKKGRPGQRTPWQLLRDSRLGDIEAGQLWHEFTGVISGTHQLRMTPGLRALIAEEIARHKAEQPAKEEPKTARLDGIGNEEWMETGRHRRVRIMEGAEARTRREAERQVWKARHGAETDKDLTDLEARHEVTTAEDLADLIDCEGAPPKVRPPEAHSPEARPPEARPPEARAAHDEPELRIKAIKREKAAERRRKRELADAAWAELEDFGGCG